MKVNEAKALVMREAFEEDGILHMSRTGESPSRPRLVVLLEAVQALAQQNASQDVVEKQLAHALQTLAVQVPVQLEVWKTQGPTHPVDDATVIDILNAIEQFYTLKK